jgi:maleate isomerase
MQKRSLIGMLTPSSNTVLEPYTSAILAALMPEVTAHFQRFTVTEIALSERALQQFDSAPLLEAARILSDARMDVIAWNGTAASWLGFEADERLCEQITATTGIQATTTILALNEVLERTNARRLGLVTPYMQDVQERIMGNYEAAGVQVVAERHLNDRGNFSFSEYDEPTIAEMIRAVAAERPDAITVLCTNMRGARLVEELEAELNIPIYDSVSVTVWKTLQMTGIAPSRIQGWGRLFQQLD